MEYNKLSKTELVRILDDIRSLRFGHGKPDPLECINLKDSFSRVDESLACYLELFDSAPVGYVVLDAAGCIVKMNPSACALVRRDRAVVGGLAFAIMLTDASRFV